MLKKSLVLPVSLLAAAIFGGAAVYALAPLNFAPRASTWVNEECTQQLLHKKRGEANGQKATVCYTYFKNDAQDGRIGSQGQQITALQSSLNNLAPNTSPVLVDANNKLLGTFLTDPSGNPLNGPTFFDAKTHRIVVISSPSAGFSQIGNSVDVNYTTADCTGTAYSTFPNIYGTSNNSMVNLYLFKAITSLPGSSKYYIIADNNIQPTPQTIASNVTNGLCTPVASGPPQAVWRLTPVAINFADPVPAPVHFR